MPDITHLRQDYARAGLAEVDLDPDPVVQFNRWLAEALAAGVPEPHAMTLATATADGVPSARVMLLRAADAAGFTFFTNYQSRKGAELATNPRAALVFFWQPLERQVRVEGTIVAVPPAESDAYFALRPRGSQEAASASAQSRVLADRTELERLAGEVAAQYAGMPVPRPPHWGGYRVVPTLVEFWQGRPSRLHDRLRYRRAGDRWVIERLSP